MSTTVALHTLAARLADEPLYGMFARYLARVVPEAQVPVCGDAFVVGGRMHGRFECAFGWMFGDDTDELAGVLERMIAGGVPLQLYLREPGFSALAAKVGGLALSEDRLFVCEHAKVVEAGADLVVLDADMPRSSCHPEIAERLPPPKLWQHFGFAYRGLVEDRRVVAVLETTVDDGRYVAIQQVFTAPERRGHGLGRRLVGRVCTELLAAGRRPLWLCATDNVASAALARSVGFTERMRIGVIESG